MFPPRDASLGSRVGASIPLEMESKGDETFEFLMPSKESVERLLTYNYQEVENSEQVLLVKKMPV